jgi:hypothetical protein
MTDAQKAALEIPAADRKEAEQTLAYEAEELLRVTPEKLAKKAAEMAPDKAREAKEIAAELMEKDLLARYINNYKGTTNYDYWALRCEFEQSRAAVAARSLVYRARRLFKEEADPVGAKKLYEEAFDRWAEVLTEFPKLKDGDGTTGDDVMVFIVEYKDVLEQLDEQLADDFPLWDIIEAFDSEQKFEVELREYKQRTAGKPAEPAKE